jgi:hypothetical protein
MAWEPDRFKHSRRAVVRTEWKIYDNKWQVPGEVCTGRHQESCCVGIKATDSFVCEHVSSRLHGCDNLIACKIRNPFDTLCSNDLVAVLAQAESMSNATGVNFHDWLIFITGPVILSSASGDDLIACVLCDPVIIRSPVEVKLRVQAALRGLRVLNLSRARFIASSLLGYRAKSRGCAPKFVGPFVVSELRKFVFRHV